MTRYIVGVDEAGRGPVIGNMFVVGLAVASDRVNELVLKGVKDSKKLTPRRRAELTEVILQLASLAVVIQVPPREIDVGNVNSLFFKSVKKILDVVTVLLGLNSIEVAVIDSPKRGVRLPYSFEVVAEPGADVKYPVVSAASIVAKHLRDTHIKYLHREFGDFGSGYPSDPRTVEWLMGFKSGEGLPPIVRRSWSTLRRLGITPGGEGLSKWLKSSD